MAVVVIIVVIGMRSSHLKCRFDHKVSFDWRTKVMPVVLEQQRLVVRLGPKVGVAILQRDASRGQSAARTVCHSMTYWRNTQTDMRLGRSSGTRRHEPRQARRGERKSRRIECT